MQVLIALRIAAPAVIQVHKAKNNILNHVRRAQILEFPVVMWFPRLKFRPGIAARAFVGTCRGVGGFLGRFYDLVFFSGDPTAATREPDFLRTSTTSFSLQTFGVGKLTLLASAGGVAAASKRPFLAFGFPL